MSAGCFGVPVLLMVKSYTLWDGPHDPGRGCAGSAPRDCGFCLAA